MTQTSRLVIEISTEAAKRNAEIIRQELQRMNAAGSNTINITNNISTNMNQAARSMDATRSAARDLIGMLGGMAVAYKAIHAADEWTGLKNRLILVTNSQQELNAAMSTTFEIAQKTGSSWENAAAVYQRFAQNAKELGINQTRVAAITETVAKATALSGGSAQSASAALTQFGQALASGVLRGEEFNSVMEQAPGLAQALAKGLGIPVGQLRALAQEGKITAKAMIDALEKVAPAIAADFDKTAFTIGQNLTKIQNAVVKFVGESNGGAAGALADSLGRVAENLNLIANIAGAAAIGYITKAMVAGTTAGYARITQLSAQIKLEQTAIAQTLRQALAEQNAATAEMSRARAAVTVAEMRVAADRQVIASNIQTLQSTQAQYRAELQLEQTRLAAQINQQGRTASITRMAQLRQAEAVVVRELQLAEAQLAATTAASSAQYAAARTAQTAATDRLAVATGRLNAAQAASAASAGLAARAGTGLMAIMGGPAGLIGLAVAAGAAFYLMRDSSDAAKDSIADQSLSIEELRKKYAGLNAETLKLKAIDAGDRIKEENDKIADSFASLDSRVYKLLSGGGTQPQAAALQGYLEDLRADGDRAAKALANLESKKVFTQGQIKSVAELGANVKASRDEISRQNQILDIATNKNQQASNAVDAHAASQNNLKNKTNEATEALKKYLSQQQSSAWKTQFAATYSAKNNLPTDFSNMVAEARQANDNKPLTQQQTNDLWKYYQAQQAVTELDKRRNDAIKAGEKAVTDREKAEKKSNDASLRAAEELQRRFDDLVLSRRSDTEVIEQEYNKNVELIKTFTKAGSSEQNALLVKEGQIRQQGLTEAKIALADRLYAYTEYATSEETLVVRHYQKLRDIALADAKLNAKQKEFALDNLDKEEQQQLAQIKLRNQQEALYAQQGYLTQIEFMRQRYALERQEIALTEGKTEEWRKAMLAASMLNQGNDAANMQFSSGAAVAGLKAGLNGTGEYFDAEQQLAQRMAIVQEGLDTETLAIQDAVALRQQIYQDYYNSITELTLSKGEEIFGSLASIAKDTAGEQSAAYRAMFAVSKGFAIAESAIKIQQALAQALGDPTAITPAQKLVNYGIIASQAANIVSSLSSVSANGFSAGGYTGPGGKYDVAGLVHKGEVVWSQDDIKRAGGVGTVEAMRTGTRVDNAIAAQSRGSGTGGNVYVYNNTSSSVSTQKDDSGNTYITIDDVRKEIDSYVPAQLARPNSSISKGLKRNYNTETRR